MSFPLYDLIVSEFPNKEIPEKTLSTFQKQLLFRYIPRLSLPDLEIVYALIYVFFQKQFPKKRHRILKLFNQKISQEGVEFDYGNLPPRLTQLLYKFICKHSKKIKEERRKKDI